MKDLIVDLFADPTCPWCFVGWKSLQMAAAQRPDVAVHVIWRPYLLRTDAPAEGVDRKAFFAARMVAAGHGAGSMVSAYLASTTVRFIATPALALSLYFLLPQKPVPILLGAAAGHLLIMVADIAAVMKSLQGSAGSSAPNA